MPQTWNNAIIYVYPANCLYGMLRKTSGSVAAGCLTSLSSSSGGGGSSLFAGGKKKRLLLLLLLLLEISLMTPENELHCKYDVLEKVQKAL